MTGATYPRRLAGAGWLEDSALRAVFRALAGEGRAVRAVGGAVRDGLLGRPVKDVDLATPLPPPEVARLASAAGLRTVPTGVAHGTMTVIAEGRPFEVTTLRRDVETFGRRARVTFTGDWAEDARRRDFTMNALYCGADGTVFDPLGGLDDLDQRRIRFIGDARERIREDYLRILRFFRFNAEFATGPLDQDGLAACVAERGGLARLSGERVRAELFRILAAPRAVEVVGIMAEQRVLAELGIAARFATLERLVALERRYGDEVLRGKSGVGVPPTLTLPARGRGPVESPSRHAIPPPLRGRLGGGESLAGNASIQCPDPLLRLAALAVAAHSDAEHLQKRLVLSNKDAERLSGLARSHGTFDGSTLLRDAKAALYRLGTGAYRDAVLIAWARSMAPLDDPQWLALLDLSSRWDAPPFPVSGREVVALGIPPGPKVGRALNAFEAWWIDQDFTTDPAKIDEGIRMAVRRLL